MQHADAPHEDGAAKDERAEESDYDQNLGQEHAQEEGKGIRRKNAVSACRRATRSTNEHMRPAAEDGRSDTAGLRARHQGQGPEQREQAGARRRRAFMDDASSRQATNAYPRTRRSRTQLWHPAPRRTCARATPTRRTHSGRGVHALRLRLHGCFLGRHFRLSSCVDVASRTTKEFVGVSKFVVQYFSFFTSFLSKRLTACRVTGQSPAAAGDCRA